ncbi:reverse transcriptase domain-containing protein [Hydrogenophaga sp.]|uniref:reverse transcriptase domain-containing protein n=1 Tax=Hydrogenophaga sp. TaxID=1904254 RepID=UPI002631A780|nr:reverse transcriptase domain-containing protein [Hydrogenophaga sp.]
MLATGVVEPLQTTSHCALSSFFVVPKKGGKWRGVLNLRWVNSFIQPRHFKMEGMREMRTLVRKGDWMTSVDLQSAYWHVPVHRDYRRWLAFQTPRGAFQFAVMPFGVSCAPRVFTKLMRDVIALLREQGIRLIIYLDDMLILAASREESLRHTHIALRLLYDLGLAINTDKSALTPSRSSEFLGFLIDTRRMQLYVPAAKRRQISDEAQSLLGEAASPEAITCRMLACFLGRTQSVALSVRHAALHWHELRGCLTRTFRRAGWWEACVLLTPAARQELHWWIDHLERWNGRAVLTPAPAMTLVTDACNWGWAALADGGRLFTRGFWTPEERAWSTNARELLAIVLALRAFRESLMPRSHVVIRTDNSTAASYINRGGGRAPHLASILHSIRSLMLEMDIELRAQHIPGVLNVAGVVPGVDHDDLRHAHHPASADGRVLGPGPGLRPHAPSEVGARDLSRLGFVRARARFCAGATERIFRSWRNPTGYDKAWREFAAFAHGRGVDPEHASIDDIVDFLHLKAEGGANYGAITKARAAICQTLQLVGRTDAQADAPALARLVRAIRLERPPVARYGEDDVVDCPRLLGWARVTAAAADCPLARLRDAAIVSLMIHLHARASDLARLPWDVAHRQLEGAVCRVRYFRTKEWRPGSARQARQGALGDCTAWVTVPAWPDDPGACPVALLRRYCERIADLPRAPGADFVFLCSRPRQGCYACLTSQRVASIVLAAMRACGLPPHLRPHAIRGQSVSDALRADPQASAATLARARMDLSVQRRHYSRAAATAAEHL